MKFTAGHFTKRVREQLARCRRDGAVKKVDLEGKSKILIGLGLAEGEEAMIALTEAGKIAWTLLDEIRLLEKRITRMRKAQVAIKREDINRLVDAELEKRGITGISQRLRDEVERRLPRSVQSQGMTCGTTNTDSFAKFLATLPPDPSCHRPAGIGAAAGDEHSAPGE